MLSKKQTQYNALISLIDEPDSKVYGLVEDEIIKCGSEIIPYLKNTFDNSFDDNVRLRLDYIIRRINFNNIKYELLKWKNNNTDLLYGLYLIAKHEHVFFDFENTEKKILEIQNDIWIEMNEPLTILEKIKTFNQVFYYIHNFRPCNAEDFNSPSNSYINEVLATRTGNSVLLSAIYIIIAQNLNLPVYGINVPNHFFCVVLNSKKDTRISFLPHGEPLFYINPFGYGQLFTQIHLSAFLKEIKVKEKPEYFIPCNNEQIIVKVLDALSDSYNNSADVCRLNQINELKQIFLRNT